MKDASVSSAADVSPAGKKLVQARLPFKVVSPATPKTPPAARKRKLSEQPSESASKINKPSKENELAEELEPLVVISDDESDTSRPPSNPYLKIVDKAIKKKLQKKTPRKKKHGKGKGTPKETDNSDKGIEKETPDNNSKLSANDSLLQATDGEVIVLDETSQNGTEGTAKLSEEKHTKEKTKNVTIKSDITVDGVEAMEIDEQEEDLSKPENETSDDIQDTEQLSANDSKTDLVKSSAPNQSDKIEAEKHEETNEKLDDSDLEIVEKMDSPHSSPDSKDSPSTTLKSSRSTEDLTNDSPNQTDEDSKTSDPKLTLKRRSTRTKAAPEKLDTSVSNLSTSKSEGALSEVTTPKQKARKTLGASTDSNEPASPANTSLTPKQLQRTLESAKKKEEKEKEKQERQKLRLQEKEERNKIRLEKEEQRKKEREEREDQKKKEKEEKEEQRRKEKEEKEKQRELEKKEREEKEEMKRKEKEEKEEQRRKEKEAREEEKRKKLEALEEEKRQKEIDKQEQEMKKKKAAAAFVNFFVPKQKTDLGEPSTSTQSKNDMLSSFTVKSDMRLAPTVRNYIDCDQKTSLDGKLKSQGLPKKDLYLQSLRDKVVKPKKSEKTWPLDDKEEDCMIVESEDELPPAAVGSGETATSSRERLRPKLLSFHENRRPPYWGTWRKMSAFVGARRPFGTDKRLDYEADSESEWEEEGEGESIAGSAAGSVDEERDEYEVDNDFFVPHGYLSDEEATMDEDDVLSLSPETQKLKLKHLEDEFESEMKKPTEKLKPRLYGMLWENGEGGKPDNCVDSLWKYFGKMAMILEDPTLLLQPPPEIEKPEKKKKKTAVKSEESPKASPKGTEKRKRSKPQKKEAPDAKKPTTEPLKNQPGINTFLTKIKSS